MKKHILTGIAILLPLWITFFILWIFIKWVSNITKPFVTIVSVYLLGIESSTFIRITSFIASIAFIYLIGVVANNIIGKKIITKVESTITTFPIIRDIYLSAKKLINFFIEYKSHHWNKVVLIEFPKAGFHSIGVVTSEIGNDKIGVFVPTTPNPTTGWLIFVDRQQVKPTSLSVEEALQIVVSGGVVRPEELEKKLS